VARGNWVLEALLCLPLPPPPPDDELAMAESLPDVKTRTPREISASRMANTTCAGCHSVMDELGFALEGYDGFGRERTHYGEGVPVESSAMLPNGMQFSGAAAVAETVAANPAFRMC